MVFNSYYRKHLHHYLTVSHPWCNG